MTSSVSRTAVSPACSLPSSSRRWRVPCRGAPDQEAGGVDLGLHVRQLDGNGLEVTALLAELLVLEAVLVRGAGDADRHRANRRAGYLEGAQGAA
jgi:hypothetical protein